MYVPTEQRLVINIGTNFVNFFFDLSGVERYFCPVYQRILSCHFLVERNPRPANKTLLLAINKVLLWYMTKILFKHAYDTWQYKSNQTNLAEIWNKQKQFNKNFSLLL